jgi:hypothetical protein
MSTGNNTYIKKSLYKDERGGEKDVHQIKLDRILFASLQINNIINTGT